jgi:hypothetical protein
MFSVRQSSLTGSSAAPGTDAPLCIQIGPNLSACRTPFHGCGGCGARQRRLTQRRRGKRNGFVYSYCGILNAFNQTGLNSNRLGPDARGNQEDGPKKSLAHARGSVPGFERLVGGRLCISSR